MKPLFSFLTPKNDINAHSYTRSNIFWIKKSYHSLQPTYLVSWESLSWTLTEYPSGILNVAYCSPLKLRNFDIIEFKFDISRPYMIPWKDSDPIAFISRSWCLCAAAFIITLILWTELDIFSQLTKHYMCI